MTTRYAKEAAATVSASNIPHKVEIVEIIEAAATITASLGSTDNGNYLANIANQALLERALQHLLSDLDGAGYPIDLRASEAAVRQMAARGDLDATTISNMVLVGHSDKLSLVTGLARDGYPICATPVPT